MPSSPYFNLETIPTATIVVLRLEADLDIAAFNDITRDLIDQWPVAAGQNVIVDLAEARYMGSVLLGLLINIRQRSHAGGGELVVAAASPRLMQVFRTANFGRLIALAPTRAEAMTMLSGS